MSFKKKKSGGLVYSTESGRLCPDCQQPSDQCRCSKKSAPAKSGGAVRVSRETKGRKGKTVTIISGLPLSGSQLLDLAKQLKQKCGSGGAVKDGQIEIQGEHRDKLVEILNAMGYSAKKSGG